MALSALCLIHLAAVFSKTTVAMEIPTSTMLLMKLAIEIYIASHKKCNSQTQKGVLTENSNLPNCPTITIKIYVRKKKNFNMWNS